MQTRVGVYPFVSAADGIKQGQVALSVEELVFELHKEQNRMGDVCGDFRSTLLLQCLGCLAQRARSIDHVIDQHAVFAFDLTDDVHDFELIGPRTTFIDDRQVGIIAPKDQAAAVRQVLRNRPYLDPNRVGVWGWSGGGSMTLNAMFKYPDLYSTGISIAPVPNQRYYDTIYQERYMGLPNDNDDVRPSIFNDDQEFGLLTDHDAYLLRALYDDRLKPGMPVETAMPKVRQIMKELFQPGVAPQPDKPEPAGKPARDGTSPKKSSALSG